MPEKTLVGIKIFEMTSNGLQEIVELETEKPSKNLDDWQKTFDELMGLIYKNEKMFMVTSELAFMINDLKTKTIVLKGVFINDSNKPGSNA